MTELGRMIGDARKRAAEGVEPSECCACHTLARLERDRLREENSRLREIIYAWKGENDLIARQRDEARAALAEVSPDARAAFHVRNAHHAVNRPDPGGPWRCGDCDWPDFGKRSEPQHCPACDTCTEHQPCCWWVGCSEHSPHAHAEVPDRIRQMVEDPDYFKKATERHKDDIRRERGLPHNHSEYVPGCARCDLSREETLQAEHAAACEPTDLDPERDKDHTLDERRGP